MHPNVRHRQGQIFRKGSGPIDADAFGVSAEMTAARQAIAAMPANHMTLAAYELAREEIFYIRTDLNDFADKFVTDNQGHRDGFPRPIVPLKNMDIGAANTGALDPNQ